MANIPEDTNAALPDDLDSIIEEATQILEQLKIEVHSISDRATKNEVQQRMKAHQKRIESAKYRKLMGDRDADAPLDDDERHEVNMARLRHARDQLRASEETASETLTNLHQQEETLRRVNANVKQTNEELATSNKLLTRMGKWWRG